MPQHTPYAPYLAGKGHNGGWIQGMKCSGAFRGQGLCTSIPDLIITEVEAGGSLTQKNKPPARVIWGSTRSPTEMELELLLN